MNVLISRTDGIGDVILTLPMAGVIKKHLPRSHVVFLGRRYTRAVVECCEHVDRFIDYDSWESQSFERQVHLLKELQSDHFVHVLPNRHLARLARKAGVPHRTGSRRRMYHWFTCNHLPNVRRRNSPFHEAQLNLQLLRPLSIKTDYKIAELHEFYGFRPKPLADAYRRLLSTRGPNLALHPKSNRSAREWGLDNFSALIDLALKKRIKVFLTGTEEEGKGFRHKLLRNSDSLVDLSGRLSLEELISFVAACDALVAASTGPLHIAAAAGIRTVGLFPPIRPIHPGRWAPLGKDCCVLVVFNPHCTLCLKGEPCQCMMQIPPEEVLESVLA